MNIIITNHASFEARQRNIAEELIKSVVQNPQQKLPSKKGRVILQSKYYDKMENKEMLLRVIGMESSGTIKVVTVYKTSKVSKYWVEGG